MARWLGAIKFQLSAWWGSAVPASTGPIDIVLSQTEVVLRRDETKVVNWHLFARDTSFPPLDANHPNLEMHCDAPRGEAAWLGGNLSPGWAGATNAVPFGGTLTVWTTNQLPTGSYLLTINAHTLARYPSDSSTTYLKVVVT